MKKSEKIVICILMLIMIILIGMMLGAKYNRKINLNNINTNVNIGETGSGDEIKVGLDAKDTEKDHIFYGKVVETSSKFIIVEPNEGEEIRKSADKIYIGLGEDNDALYRVGTNVKITYSGDVMETYPAQIEASKIEIKSAENFEIIFYDKQPQTDIKEHKIIDKNETDKYDYDIYVYEGSTNIVIDGKTYSLRNALLENKITMEEIIAKANNDFPNALFYKDGGSAEYHYESYTIIKCHTEEGNRDVYIGNKYLKLNDVI